MMLGIGEQGFAFFALNAFVSTLLASLLVMIGAVGEEAGWRGVLQPELERRFGAFKGTVLVGLVWGYWHLPANLAGYNDGEHPLLGSLVLFPLATVGMSFAFAWLTRRSGSVWPAALAHGVNNVASSGLFVKPGGWLADRAVSLVVSVVLAALFLRLLTARGGAQALAPERA
jgi:membrane protease YdiL (CAAX protease family)